MTDQSPEPCLAGRWPPSGGQLDLIIVGAGFAGLYMLYSARRRGLSARLYEQADGVGGTWYWNRYPGARVDLESVEYSYSFSPELQAEWEWSERYAAQPELLRYLNHVADRFDLRRDIRFETRVTAASFDDTHKLWRIETTPGDTVSALFLVLATGFLSAPIKPAIRGLETYTGKQYQTSRWPREPVDFSGQRVGVIGTGSTGIQCIPLIAQQARQLFVFQRTAHFSVPLQNCAMRADFDQMVKANYAALRRVERNSFGGFVITNHSVADSNNRSALEVSAEARRHEYEYRWRSGGLCFYNSYRDLLFNKEANDTLADFVRAKIREKVHNPVLAEQLTPLGTPIMAKRLCADTHYYETFNRDNVTLIDIRRSPIEEATSKGLRVGGSEYALDSIVFATGFDAVTGAILGIDIRGRAGQSIQQHWSDGPRTCFGLMAAGFPNLFLLNGPGSPCVLFNPILLAEDQSEWVLDAIKHLRAARRATIEPTTTAEDDWSAHVAAVAEQSLFPLADSWYMGANIPGKPRVMLAYLGGYPAYSKACNLAAANAYRQNFLLRA